MAALTALLPKIAPFVAGAPDIAMVDAARNAAIDFCKRTLTLERTLAAVLTVADASDLTLVQSGEVVHKLLGAKLDGKPLDLLTPSELDGLGDADPVTTPTGALMVGPMLLRLHPTPTLSNQSLVARAAMCPSQAATTIDDALLERHAQALADYAVYWLQTQPNTAYSDAKAAAGPLARYMEAASRERIAMLNHRSRARTRPGVNWC